MKELPMWSLHTLDGKYEVEFINGIATYGESFVKIDDIELGLLEFNITHNKDEYTLKGVVYYSYGDTEPINIFINYNKRYIILGK